MLYQRRTDAGRRCRDGDGQRRSLLRSRVSIAKNRKLGGWLIAFAWLATASVSLAQQPVELQPVEAKPTELQPMELVAPANRMTAGSVTYSVPNSAVSAVQVRSATQWLCDFAIRKMPRRYDGEKDWGKTKQIWAGVDMRMDGLRLKTHRRHRDVKHGRWIQYELKAAPLPSVGLSSPAGAQIQQPIQAQQPTLVIDRVSPDRTGAGTFGAETFGASTFGAGTLVARTPDYWRLESTAILPMTFTARIQRWNLGARLFSVTVSGSIRLKVRTTTSVGFVMDYAEIPPALVLDPTVIHADVILEQFKVNRVSHVGGELAQGWGEVVEEVLVERLVQKQSDRLTSKLNRAIDKNRDDLRFSMAGWLTGFAN